MRGRGLQLLRYLGLLMGLLGMLAGCGGSSGSSDASGTVARGRPLSLQLQLSSQPSSQTVLAVQHAGLAAVQTRQVQPGDPGFIERFAVRLQAQGRDLAPPQIFMLDATEQDTVSRDVMVPDTAPETFQVLVSAFTSQGIEVFRGDTTVALGQTSAMVTLIRSALVPVPATPANLQQTTFFFADGAIFGLANRPATLATGTFVGHVGDFALTANGLVASGNVAIGSCTFVVTTSTFPGGQGLQVGDQLVVDPCQVDAIDRRLIATNSMVSSTPTISSPPMVTPPDTALHLPPASPLVIDEGTAGAFQVAAAVSGTRPGAISLGITVPPAHGTATLSNTGVVTYQPIANFNGSDRLVVTVVVSFTDNNSPALLLGTVLIPITVRPVNHAPVPTALGISTPQHTPGTSQISANDPDAGQVQTFSVSTLPAHGVATVSPSGLATYTPAPGFSGPDSFAVTVTDNGTPPLSGTVTIAVTVLAPPNRAPVPTALGISTPQHTPGTSQISANDPDAGQVQTFSVTPPPGHGLATISPSGLATYTPALGFSGPDSFAVMVTDNGTPPLSGTVTIAVTVRRLFGTDASVGNLLTLDPATGMGTLVGPMGIGPVPALALDPTTGTMYAAPSNGNADLYRVDPGTGATSLLGSTGLAIGDNFVTVGDMAFSPEGTLYAAVNIAGGSATGSDTLVTIDKTTGKATIIGPFVSVCPQPPCTIDGMEAIAFDTTGNLFGALRERGAVGIPGLYKIDSKTGMAIFLAPILDANGVPLSGGVVSLQFCGRLLFGGTARDMTNAEGPPTAADDGGRLIIIDPATGLFGFAGAVSATGGSSLGALACQ
jgi:hypothetical protein